MKKELLLVIVIMLILSLTEKIGVKAVTSNEKDVTISKVTADVTGDEKKERIVLTGVKLKGGYYKNLEMDITASNQRHYMIKLQDGYKPSLQLVDVTQDGVKDLFACTHVYKNGVNTLQTLYTLENYRLTKLSLPDPLVLESHFINGYKAKINIRKTGSSYEFDLKDRKKYYEKLGIFLNGKLNEPTELMVNSFSNLEPVMLKGDKIGLKGIQKITGVSDSDTIGYVESSWVFDRSQWNLENVVIQNKLNS